MTNNVPGQGDMGSDTSTYDLLGQLTASTTAVPYIYDALGRRVATRFDQACDDELNRYNAPCHVSGIRRTIWDGAQELGEIQLPTEQLENDTYVGQGTFTSSSLNLAPFYGAVAYAYDGRIDQPMAIQRLRYANLTPSNTIVELAAFTYNPVWNVQGTVSNVVGDTSTLPAPACPESMLGGTRATCFSWVIQRHALAYRDVSTVWPRAWQGTLLQDKVGAGGLMYRRNRYYDSKSGRFTQEDPIGLAGGLNLYGYANGDPVNFSDPYGLCPQNLSLLRGLLCNSIEATTTFVGAVGGFLGGGGAGALAAVPTAGLAAPLTVPAGAVEGALVGAVAGRLAGSVISNALFSKDGGEFRGGRQSTRDSDHRRLMKEFDPTREERTRIHEEISKQKRGGDLDFDELRQIFTDIVKRRP